MGRYANAAVDKLSPADRESERKRAEAMAEKAEGEPGHRAKANGLTGFFDTNKFTGKHKYVHMYKY